MVTITVLFEGGANPASNPNEATVENTTYLREAFNRLLNSDLPTEKIKVQAQPVYSITNAVKIRQKDAFLLIDLDEKKDEKKKRLEDNKLLDIQDFVFFMVQRMEAWILSQPDVIEKVFENFKSTKLPIADDNGIKGKNPEEISKPDWILDIILQRFFSYEKAGKVKKLKYGKLKHAPQLIENLDLKKLCEDFEDVRCLVEKITSFA